jgi:organic hydroperoxide reductase OsmC/OhrA
MARTHEYGLDLTWTGTTGGGYLSYPREHQITIDGKPALNLSADRAFLGDPALHNPEELLLCALSSCHLLSYLALTARARITVLSYHDRATGTMAEDGRGGGRFTHVLLRPQVVVADAADIERATALHHDAGETCFVAASVNFPVEHAPVVRAVPPSPQTTVA